MVHEIDRARIQKYEDLKFFNSARNQAGKTLAVDQ